MENQGIIKVSTKSALTLDNISVSPFQKAKTKTAMLRQTVTTNAEYPSARIANSKQDNLFGAEAFGFESQKFSSVENRVAFINVPETATEADVKAKIAALPSACIYKALSNRPLLTEDQEYAIANNITSMEVIGNSQVVRYPAGTTKNGADVSGKIVLDNNGKVQYRATYFSQTAKEDEDYRNVDASDFFITEEIENELNAVSASQGTRIASQSLAG